MNRLRKYIDDYDVTDISPDSSRYTMYETNLHSDILIEHCETNDKFGFEFSSAELVDGEYMSLLYDTCEEWSTAMYPVEDFN